MALRATDSELIDFINRGGAAPGVPAAPSKVPVAQQINESSRLLVPQEPKATTAPDLAPLKMYNLLGRGVYAADMEALEGFEAFVRRTEVIKKGPQGFFKRLLKAPSAEDIPFVGDAIGLAVPLSQYKPIADTFRKLNAGENVSDQDRLYAALFLQDMDIRQNTTLGGAVGDIARMSAPLMLEYAIAGAVGAKLSMIPGPVDEVVGAVGGFTLASVKATYHGGKALIKRGLYKAAREGAEKSARKFISEGAGKVVKKYAKGAITGAGDMVQQGVVRGAIAQVPTSAALMLGGKNPLDTRQALERYALSAAGGDDEAIGRARGMALADHAIEFVSESSGEWLAHIFSPGKHLVRKVGGVPVGTSIAKHAGTRLGDLSRRVVADKSFIGKGLKTVREKGHELGVSLWGVRLAKIMNTLGVDAETGWRILEKGGHNGWLAELGEERFGGFVRGLLGVEGDDASVANAIDQMIPSMDQLKAEAIGFAIPGLAASALHTGSARLALGSEGVTEMSRNATLFSRWYDSKADSIDSDQITDRELSGTRADRKTVPTAGEAAKAVERMHALDQAASSSKHGIVNRVARAAVDAATSIATMNIDNWNYSTAARMMAARGIPKMTEVYDTLYEAAKVQVRKKNNIVNAETELTEAQDEEAREQTRDALAQQMGRWTDKLVLSGRLFEAMGISDNIDTPALLERLEKELADEDGLIRKYTRDGTTVYQLKNSVFEPGTELAELDRDIAEFLTMQGLSLATVNTDDISMKDRPAGYALDKLGGVTWQSSDELREVANNPTDPRAQSLLGWMNAHQQTQPSIQDLSATLNRLADLWDATEMIEVTREDGSLFRARVDLNGQVDLEARNAEAVAYLDGPGKEFQRGYEESKLTDNGFAFTRLDRNLQLTRGIDIRGKDPVRFLYGLGEADYKGVLSPRAWEAYLVEEAAITELKPDQTKYDALSQEGKKIWDRAAKAIGETYPGAVPAGQRTDQNQGKFAFTAVPGAVNNRNTLVASITGGIYHMTEDSAEQAAKHESAFRDKAAGQPVGPYTHAPEVEQYLTALRTELSKIMGSKVNQPEQRSAAKDILDLIDKKNSVDAFSKVFLEAFLDHANLTVRPGAERPFQDAIRALQSAIVTAPGHEGFVSYAERTLGIQSGAAAERPEMLGLYAPAGFDPAKLKQWRLEAEYKAAEEQKERAAKPKAAPKKGSEPGAAVDMEARRRVPPGSLPVGPNEDLSIMQGQNVSGYRLRKIRVNSQGETVYVLDNGTNARYTNDPRAAELPKHDKFIDERQPTPAQQARAAPKKETEAKAAVDSVPPKADGSADMEAQNPDAVMEIEDAAAKAAGFTIGPLFHTPRTEEPFREFNTEKGAWFADSPDYAEALIAGKRANKYRVYIRMRNPLDMRPLGEEATKNDVAAFYERHGVRHVPYRDRGPVFDEPKGRQFFEAVRNAGYDGVILREDATEGGTSYIALNAEDIRITGDLATSSPLTPRPDGTLEGMAEEARPEVVASAIAQDEAFWLAMFGESMGGNAGRNRIAVNYLHDGQQVVFWGNFQFSPGDIRAAYERGNLKHGTLLLEIKDGDFENPIVVESIDGLPVFKGLAGSRISYTQPTPPIPPIEQVQSRIAAAPAKSSVVENLKKREAPAKKAVKPTEPGETPADAADVLDLFNVDVADAEPTETPGISFDGEPGAAASAVQDLTDSDIVDPDSVSRDPGDVRGASIMGGSLEDSLRDNNELYQQVSKTNAQEVNYTDADADAPPDLSGLPAEDEAFVLEQLQGLEDGGRIAFDFTSETSVHDLAALVHAPVEAAETAWHEDADPQETGLDSNTAETLGIGSLSEKSLRTLNKYGPLIRQFEALLGGTNGTGYDSIWRITHGDAGDRLRKHLESPEAYREYISNPLTGPEYTYLEKAFRALIREVNVAAATLKSRGVEDAKGLSLAYMRNMLEELGSFAVRARVINVVGFKGKDKKFVRSPFTANVVDSNKLLARYVRNRADRLARDETTFRKLRTEFDKLMSSIAGKGKYPSAVTVEMLRNVSPEQFTQLVELIHKFSGIPLNVLQSFGRNTSFVNRMAAMAQTLNRVAFRAANSPLSERNDAQFAEMDEAARSEAFAQYLANPWTRQGDSGALSDIAYIAKHTSGGSYLVPQATTRAPIKPRSVSGWYQWSSAFRALEPFLESQGVTLDNGGLAVVGSFTFTDESVVEFQDMTPDQREVAAAWMLKHEGMLDLGVFGAKRMGLFIKVDTNVPTEQLISEYEEFYNAQAPIVQTGLRPVEYVRELAANPKTAMSDLYLATMLWSPRLVDAIDGNLLNYLPKGATKESTDQDAVHGLFANWQKRRSLSLTPGRALTRLGRDLNIVVLDGSTKVRDAATGELVELNDLLDGSLLYDEAGFGTEVNTILGSDFTKGDTAQMLKYHMKFQRDGVAYSFKMDGKSLNAVSRTPSDKNWVPQGASEGLDILREILEATGADAITVRSVLKTPSVPGAEALESGDEFLSLVPGGGELTAESWAANKDAFLSSVKPMAVAPQDAYVSQNLTKLPQARTRRALVQSLGNQISSHNHELRAALHARYAELVGKDIAALSVDDLVGLLLEGEVAEGTQDLIHELKNGADPTSGLLARKIDGAIARAIQKQTRFNIYAVSSIEAGALNGEATPGGMDEATGEQYLPRMLLSHSGAARGAFRDETAKSRSGDGTVTGWPTLEEAIAAMLEDFVEQFARANGIRYRDYAALDARQRASWNVVRLFDQKNRQQLALSIVDGFCLWDSAYTDNEKLRKELQGASVEELTEFVEDNNLKLRTSNTPFIPYPDLFRVALADTDGNLLPGVGVPTILLGEDGRPDTSTVLAQEFRNDSPGIEGYTIPGSLGEGTRIPADGDQSHIMYRLRSKLNANVNIITTDVFSRMNRGADLDGDALYVALLQGTDFSMDSKVGVHNRMFLLLADGNYKPENVSWLERSIGPPHDVVRAEAEARLSASEKEPLYFNDYAAVKKAQTDGWEGERAIGPAARGNNAMKVSTALGMHTKSMSNAPIRVGDRDYRIGRTEAEAKWLLTPEGRELRKSRDFVVALLVQLSVDDVKFLHVGPLRMTRERLGTYMAIMAYNDQWYTEEFKNLPSDQIIEIMTRRTMRGIFELAHTPNNPLDQYDALRAERNARGYPVHSYGSAWVQVGVGMMGEEALNKFHRIKVEGRDALLAARLDFVKQFTPVGAWLKAQEISSMLITMGNIIGLEMGAFKVPTLVEYRKHRESLAEFEAPASPIMKGEIKFAPGYLNSGWVQNRRNPMQLLDSWYTSAHPIETALGRAVEDIVDPDSKMRDAKIVALDAFMMSATVATGLQEAYGGQVPAFTGSAAEALAALKRRFPGVKLIQELEADPKRSGTLQLISEKRDLGFSEQERDELRAEFDALPRSLQYLLAAHTLSEHGPSDSTRNGGFGLLLGMRNGKSAFRKALMKGEAAVKDRAKEDGDYADLLASQIANKYAGRRYYPAYGSSEIRVDARVAQGPAAVETSDAPLAQRWSEKELWNPDRLAEDFARYGNKAAWVQYHVSTDSEKKAPTMQGTMYFKYGKNDPGSEYGTTFAAIKAGARTSTTRFAKWPQFEKYSSLKPGDVVRFWSGRSVNAGEFVDVTVDVVGQITPADLETGPATAAQGFDATVKTSDATPQSSLAKTNTKTHEITVDEAAVREDWDAGFPYLRGQSDLAGSAQKREVFAQVDLDKFRDALGSPERYIEFIRAHEAGHLELHIKPGKSYPKDWMDPVAIRMEREANKYALDALGISVSDIRSDAPASTSDTGTDPRAWITREIAQVSKFRSEVKGPLAKAIDAVEAVELAEAGIEPRNALVSEEAGITAELDWLASDGVIAAFEQHHALLAPVMKRGMAREEAAPRILNSVTANLIAGATEANPLAEPAVKAVNIYFGTGENKELSNFAERPFTLGEVQYKSVEHYFQTIKVSQYMVDDSESGTAEEALETLYGAVLAAETGAKAKRLGGTRVPGVEFLGAEWDKDSAEVMKEGLRASFEQNPEARAKLLATGDAQLTHTQDKSKWGEAFPRLLMEVRAELSPEQMELPLDPRTASLTAGSVSSDGAVSLQFAGSVTPKAEKLFAKGNWDLRKALTESRFSKQAIAAIEQFGDDTEKDLRALVAGVEEELLSGVSVVRSTVKGQSKPAEGADRENLVFSRELMARIASGENTSSEDKAPFIRTSTDNPPPNSFHRIRPRILDVLNMPDGVERRAAAVLMRERLDNSIARDYTADWATPSKQYESRSLNKGEYQEWFVKSPFPVPGQHGAFQDPDLMGWFRVRAYESYLEVQEIQSELFQKNKGGFAVSEAAWIDQSVEAYEAAAMGGDTNVMERLSAPPILDPQQATFLNLLSSDQTWVPVFVNMIKSWAAEQGYEKVRFPTGETAAKVEGHETQASRLPGLREDLEAASGGPVRAAWMTPMGVVPRGYSSTAQEAAFAAELARRIASRGQGESERVRDSITAEMMEETAVVRDRGDVASISTEIANITGPELARVAPIEAFYENRVKKHVKKLGGMEQVTDSNGNTWYEVPVAKAAEADPRTASVYAMVPAAPKPRKPRHWEAKSMAQLLANAAYGDVKRMNLSSTAADRGELGRINKDQEAFREALKKAKTLSQALDVINRARDGEFKFKRLFPKERYDRLTRWAADHLERDTDIRDAIGPYGILEDHRLFDDAPVTQFGATDEAQKLGVPEKPTQLDFTERLGLSASFMHPAEYYHSLTGGSNPAGTVAMQQALETMYKQIGQVSTPLSRRLKYLTDYWGANDRLLGMIWTFRKGVAGKHTVPKHAKTEDFLDENDRKDLTAVLHAAHLELNDAETKGLFIPSEMTPGRDVFAAGPEAVMAALRHSLRDTMSPRMLDAIEKYVTLKFEEDANPIVSGLVSDFDPADKLKVKGRTVYSMRLPIDLVEAVWQDGDAVKKLVRNGREKEKLTIAALNAELDAEYKRTGELLKGHLDSYFGADSGMFNLRTRYAPQYSGRGFLGDNTDVLKVALNRELKESLADEFARRERAYEAKFELVRVFGIARHRTEIEDATPTMLETLFGLLGVDFENKAKAVSAIKTGKLVRFDVLPSDSFEDVAQKIYALSMERAMAIKAMGESIRTGVPNTAITDLAGFLNYAQKAFKNAKKREYSGRTHARKFRTFDEAFTEAGRLPDSITALDALAKYSADIVAKTARKIALNKVLSLTDAGGNLLVIADPNTAVSDNDPQQLLMPEVWHQTLLIAGDMYGFKRKAGQTIKEAVREFVQQLQATNRYKTLDSQFASVDRFLVLKGDPGEDNVISIAMDGGTVGALLSSLVEPNYTDATGILDKVAQLNWMSKKASLMGSLFFHKAMLESLAAGTVGQVSVLKPKSLFGKGASESEYVHSLRDIEEMLKTNDPFIADLLELAGEMGVQLSASSTPIGTRLDMSTGSRTKILDGIRTKFSEPVARGVARVAELPERQAEFTFDTVFNTGKLAFMLNALEFERAKREAAGLPFTRQDQRRALAPWVDTINAEMGGPEYAKYAWLSPKVRKILNVMMFSFPWTFSAWNAGGGGMLTGRFMGNTPTQKQAEYILTKRWPAMVALVMLLEPMALQLAAWAATGGPDDDDEMKPFTWQNEHGKRMHADITRILKLQPWYDEQTTGSRRYYIRWGKQAYEVGRWFTDTNKAFLSKTSPVVHAAWELFTGRVLGYPEWELGFHDAGAAGLFLSPKEGFLGSRAGYVLHKFVPFSVLAAKRDPNKMMLTAFGPVSKGTSMHNATEKMAKILNTWAAKRSYDQIYNNRRAKANLEALGKHVLDAAERNGIDPDKVLSSARGAVLKEYYAKLYHAIKKDDVRKAEYAAREIMRLNGASSSMLRSAKQRESIRGRKMSPEMAKAIRESFRIK